MSVFFINPFLGAVGGDFESIATVTVGSGGAAEIEFTSIPGTYQHLQLRVVARTSRATSNDYMGIRVNGDTANYAYHSLGGTGSSAFASGSASQAYVYTPNILTAANSTASVFAALYVDVLDYANSSKATTLRGFGGQDQNGSGNVGLFSGLWTSTNAVTSLALTTGTGTNWVQHSTAALYGIKAP